MTPRTFLTLLFFALVCMLFLTLITITGTLECHIARERSKILSTLNLFVCRAWFAFLRAVFKFRQLTIDTHLELPPQDQWYLITANHQSWFDIMVIFTEMGPHFPRLKYIIKKDLYKVPFLGAALWALRYITIDRRPQKAKNNLQQLVSRSKSYTHLPTSLVVFPEGTRFSKDKTSPYQYLLKPRTAGFSKAITHMQKKNPLWIDLTIHYNHPQCQLLDILQGRVTHITLKAKPVMPLKDINASSLKNTLHDLWNAKETTLGDLQ